MEGVGEGGQKKLILKQIGNCVDHIVHLAGGISYQTPPNLRFAMENRRGSPMNDG